MKLLLDTHAALFMWIEPSRLGQTARTLLSDPTNKVIFSQVSTWEICLKHRLGKLPLPQKPATYLKKRMRESDLTYEPISDAALFSTVDLPLLHKDPFDRLLVATARELDVPLVTTDASIIRYDVKTLW